MRSVLNWLAVLSVMVGLGSYFAFRAGWLEKTTSIQLVALLAILVAILDIVCALKTRVIFLRGVAISLDENRPAFLVRILLSLALLAAGAYAIVYVVWS